jgi:hypothetical protein
MLQSERNQTFLLHFSDRFLIRLVYNESTGKLSLLPYNRTSTAQCPILDLRAGPSILISHAGLGIPAWNRIDHIDV